MGSQEDFNQSIVGMFGPQEDKISIKETPR